MHEVSEVGIDHFDLRRGDNLGPDALGAQTFEGGFRGLMGRCVLPVSNVVDRVRSYTESAGQNLGRHFSERESVDRKFFRTVKLALTRRRDGLSEGLFIKFDHFGILSIA